MCTFFLSSRETLHNGIYILVFISISKLYRKSKTKINKKKEEKIITNSYLSLKRKSCNSLLLYTYSCFKPCRPSARITLQAIANEYAKIHIVPSCSYNRWYIKISQNYVMHTTHASETYFIECICTCTRLM